MVSYTADEVNGYQSEVRYEGEAGSSYDEATTGSFETGMKTNSVFELKYNDKFYKETEKIVNKYASGNLDLSSESKVNTNIEW